MFARPSVTPKSITVRPLDHVNQAFGTLAAATVELYDRLTIARGTTSADAHVIGIKHDITARGWSTSFEFRPLFGTGADVITNPSTGANTGPADAMQPPPGILGSRYQSTAQAIASSGVFTAVDFNALIAMDGGITWSTTSKWFVVPKAGRYHMPPIVAPLMRRNCTPSSIRGRVVKLAANDTVAVQAYQTAAANHPLSNAGTWFDVAWIGD